MANENLLKETTESLKYHGKTIEDVRFISGGGYEIPMTDFIRIANGFNYNSGYGHQYVPDDLMLVGEDWWMERYEYDGSECWSFMTKPTRPDKLKKLIDIDGDEYAGRKYKWNDVKK